MPKNKPKKTAERIKTIKPTVLAKRKLLLNELQNQVRDNAGKRKLSMREAMIKIGYSPMYAKDPQKITRGMAWAEIMDVAFPQDAIADLMMKQLNASKVRTLQFPGKMPDEAIEEGCELCGFYVTSISPFMGAKYVTIIQPDFKTRHDSLDQIHKMRGLYKETIVMQGDKYRKMSDAELAMAIKQATKFFTKGK